MFHRTRNEIVEARSQRQRYLTERSYGSANNVVLPGFVNSQLSR